MLYYPKYRILYAWSVNDIRGWQWSRVSSSPATTVTWLMLFVLEWHLLYQGVRT